MGRYLLVALLMALLAMFVVKIYENYPSGRVGVIFYCVSNDLQERKVIEARAESLSSLRINSTTPVTVIVHGYTESSSRSWVKELTNVILATKARSAVILVDYWDLTTISRPYMAENVRNVASQTAALLDLLTIEKGIELSQVHLIGFSLGGRISGQIGNKVKSGKIGRITGLDASYPWHHPVDDSEVLDASDADLVISLRTSPVGARSPPAHIDFYGNDGLNQPGCQRWFFPRAVQNMCSHYRAVSILIEAAKSAHKKLFPACLCESWEKLEAKLCPCQVINHFGLFPDPSSKGAFYLTTNSEPPYSRHFE